MTGLEIGGLVGVGGLVGAAGKALADVIIARYGSGKDRLEAEAKKDELALAADAQEHSQGLDIATNFQHQFEAAMARNEKLQARNDELQDELKKLIRRDGSHEAALVSMGIRLETSEKRHAECEDDRRMLKLRVAAVEKKLGYHMPENPREYVGESGEAVLPEEEADGANPPD